MSRFNVEQIVDRFSKAIDQEITRGTKFKNKIDIVSDQYFGPLGVGDMEGANVVKIVIEKLSSKYPKFQIDIVNGSNKMSYVESRLVVKAPCDWSM